MIKFIEDINLLRKTLDSSESSHYSDNIRFLADCYGTDTPFCKFYNSGASIICIFENTFVIICDNGISDYEELTAFICGYSEINASQNCVEKIFPWLNGFENIPVDFQTNISSSNKKAEINDSPDLKSVFNIISSGFDNIDFNSWYVDTSHKVRHNLAKCFIFNNSSTATASFYKSGVFLSQIATLPTQRHKGYACAMLSAIKEIYEGKRIYLIAEHSKRPFYKACGFQITGSAGRLRKI